MGKLTHPAVRSLLAVLNLRLGQWIPNPASGDMRKRVSELAATAEEADSKSLVVKPGLHYYVRETIGLHPLGADLIYATDGGHYENLGLVELLRRRCSEIWCIDASADPPGTYLSISESLLLAQGELGVTIDVALDDLALDDTSPRTLPSLRTTHVHGSVRYVDGAECALHIVKIGIDKNTPDDLREMRNRYRKFPHDSTFNQLYTAERFDAYRELGYASTKAALADALQGAARSTREETPARTRKRFGRVALCRIMRRLNLDTHC